MTLNIGKHLDMESALRGDFRAMCDRCGSMHMRSKLVRKADGLLSCPRDRHIRDGVTLARLDAESFRRPPPQSTETAGYDVTDNDTATPNVGEDDIYL